MQFSINAGDLSEMVLESNFPENYFDINTTISSRTTKISQSFGEGVFEEIFFEGMHIAYGDMRFKQHTKLFFESNYETVEMHFDLCGTTFTDISGGQTYTFSDNRHNLIYVPGVKGQIQFAKENVRMLEINLMPALFKKYMEDEEAFEQFMKMVRNQSPALLGKHNLPIPPTMMHIIKGILDCPKMGMFKRMYLEAKVIELLLMQLEQFSTHDCKDFCSLKKADIDKMHHAKEIILKQLYNPCSLIDLARQIGTNEFTLKKGFKEVFGTTVFGMVSDIRMEEAKALLLSGEKNVTEISELIGYKHPAHFNTAFKKKFGITPGKFLK
ncbi:AraC family transcriptional regulator [Chitinophaga sancti]|uniref:helix-turn-helix transcriptional regulator n=1 Tax=Chitinophaga sancti TaxID=1004 RepID=UPI002A748B91|nr:AraC family transcriptional regulator [Chitinophaga sancti]WPQ60113.1 AraC family transcriptional regulator [Chitinophaga sancti]